MRLYEYEAKQLFSKMGIAVPNGLLVSGAAKATAAKKIASEVMVKAQVLSGKRSQSGGVLSVKADEAAAATKKLLGKVFGGETVRQVLIEKRLPAKAEYYAAITFDTTQRAPVVIVSKSGGVDIEEVKVKNPGAIVSQAVDIRRGLTSWEARLLLKKAGFDGRSSLKVSRVLLSLWNCFRDYDCRLAEINPLVETEDGEYVAADAKIILDEQALFRHADFEFPPREVLGRKQTAAELAAKEIDRNDHRGTAGSTYLDLGGDIAVIAAGGGGSLVCMDALLEFGGRPANFTEHSGNPPAEKLEKLTRIALSKKGLKGCWFVGGTANFTDIYETLRGFLEALRKIRPRPSYPIVIRRGGPRDKEAFAMLKEAAKKEGWKFTIFGSETPMTSTAKTIVDLAYGKKR